LNAVFNLFLSPFFTAEICSFTVEMIREEKEIISVIMATRSIKRNKMPDDDEWGLIIAFSIPSKHIITAIIAPAIIYVLFFIMLPPKIKKCAAEATH